jgi:hypothetical protein
LKPAEPLPPAPPSASACAFGSSSQEQPLTQSSDAIKNSGERGEKRRVITRARVCPAPIAAAKLAQAFR